MKKVDDLGISPAPWYVGKYSWQFGEVRRVENDSEYGQVDRVICKMNQWDDEELVSANARLIAAAPKLYEFLREAVVEYCQDCPLCRGENYACTNNPGKCFVQRWRDALAEAAGETVTDCNRKEAAK